MLESVLDDGGAIWDNFQALFLIHVVAKRAVARNRRAVLDLAVKYHGNSFPAQIGFILGNGQPQVDIQPPAVLVSYCSCVVFQPQLWASKTSMTL